MINNFDDLKAMVSQSRDGMRVFIAKDLSQLLGLSRVAKNNWPLAVANFEAQNLIIFNRPATINDAIIIYERESSVASVLDQARLI